MTNELAMLIMIAIWLKTGRGFNLCLLIVAYYILYEISHAIYYNIPHQTATEFYYLAQIFIDLTILFVCLLLACKDIKQSFIILLYGLVVFSSLAVEGLSLIDDSLNKELIIDLYDLRQEYSHALDLIFAVLGSGRGELINNLNLFIRVRRVYNRLININSDTQNKPL